MMILNIVQVIFSMLNRITMIFSCWKRLPLHSWSDNRPHLTLCSWLLINHFDTVTLSLTWLSFRPAKRLYKCLVLSFSTLNYSWRSHCRLCSFLWNRWADNLCVLFCTLSYSIFRSLIIRLIIFAYFNDPSISMWTEATTMLMVLFSVRIII